METGESSNILPNGAQAKPFRGEESVNTGQLCNLLANQAQERGLVVPGEGRERSKMSPAEGWVRATSGGGGWANVWGRAMTNDTKETGTYVFSTISRSTAQCTLCSTTTH